MSPTLEPVKSPHQQLILLEQERLAKFPLTSLEKPRTENVAQREEFDDFRSRIMLI